MDATSFEVRCPGGLVDPVFPALAKTVASVASPRVVFLFACGVVARALFELGTALVARVPASLPIVLASGTGVLSNAGEIEGDSAITGLVLGGGVPPDVSLQPEVEGLGAWLDQRGPALLLVRSEDASPDDVAIDLEGPVIGAGTIGDPGLVLVHDGQARRAVGIRVALAGALCPRVGVAHSIRLLSELWPVTGTHGKQITALGGKASLERLAESTRELAERATLITVLARREPRGPEDWLVRPIAGVDPDRGGVFVGPEASRARYAGFAVRDATVAAQRIEACCRALRRELRGSAPRAGLFFSSDTRGRAFYGSAGVDVRALAQGFPNVPFAGLHGAFQLAPLGSAVAAQLHAGTLGVICRQS